VEPGRSIKYEKHAASQGDWRKTPIGETPSARATDPANIQKNHDSWWRRAEPRDVDGKELLRLLEKDVAREESRRRKNPRYMHDDKDDENKSFGSNRSEPKYVEDESFESYLPGENDLLQQWLATLGKEIDANLPRTKNLFGTIRNFIMRFGAAARFRDLKENERATLRIAVKRLCEAYHQKESEAA